MLDHLLDMKHWGVIEFVVAFVTFNAIALPIAWKLSNIMWERWPRLEAALGYMLLPVALGAGIYAVADDLARVGIPIGWSTGACIAAFVLWFGGLAIWTARRG